MQRVNMRITEVAVGLWLLIDLQRVWAPSLITVFGQAASTPAELMGLFALAVVASPGLVLTLTRRGAIGTPAGVATWCLGGALAARVVVQVVDGGQPQLWAATLGMVLALSWLCLAVRHGGRDLLAGVFTGLALATVTHAALGTWGAVWRDDVWGWLLLALQAGLVGRVFLAHRAARQTELEQPRHPITWALAFGVQPALLVAGIALANVGRATADAGVLGAGLVVAGVVVAAGLVMLRPPVLRAVVVIDVVLVVGATWLVLDEGRGSGSSVAAAVGVVALAGVLLALTPTVPSSPGERVDAGWRDPMWAMWAGGVLWVLVFFGYYAGYDLGYRADWLVVALAAFLGMVATWTTWRHRPSRAAQPAGEAATPEPRVDRPAPARRGASALALLLATAVGFGLAVVAPSATIRPVERHEADRGDTLTVMAWNLRMGYGMDGRFRPREVAELIAEEDPDVVLVSEVDRGWLLNGGQDQLEILARLLDMEAHFGPAADPVWGDAILTALPVERVVTRPLPDFGAVTGAQVMAATVTKNNRAYDVVSTHLQPADHGPGQGSLLQARRIAAFVEDRLTDGRPLILGGDFNVTPGTESWQALLDAGVDDGLHQARPLFTSPADAPDQQIDHLFVSHGTWVQTAWAVSTELSDHFPVLITIAPPVHEASAQRRSS